VIASKAGFRMRYTKIAAAMLAVSTLTACGASGSVAWAPGPYTDPTQMIAKAKAAGFDCTVSPGDAPTYDIYGALTESCSHGTASEPVSFDVFKSANSQAAAAASMVKVSGWGAEFIGSGWGVFAMDPATVDQLKAALS
jgi:hypothetical protein